MKGIQMVCISLVLLWIGFAANAWAISIVFTDIASWQTAVSGIGYTTTNIDFENATRTLTNGIYTVTSGDVNFTSNGTGVPISVGVSSNYGTGNFLNFDFNVPTRVTLPTSVYAFGFNFGDGSGSNTPGLMAYLNYVTLLTGETFGPYQGSYTDFAFFGVLSDDPMSSLLLRTGSYDSDAILDNFIYAQAGDPTAPVPEPASLLLVGSGLIGVAMMRKKINSMISNSTTQ